MIERFKAAVKAFRNPEPEPIPEDEPMPVEAPCPKCGKPGMDLMVQQATATSKTHYCSPCQKFYRPA